MTAINWARSHTITNYMAALKTLNSNNTVRIIFCAVIVRLIYDRFGYRQTIFALSTSTNK